MKKRGPKHKRPKQRPARTPGQSQTRSHSEPPDLSALATQTGSLSLELGRRAYIAGHWRETAEYAEAAMAQAPNGALALLADANLRRIRQLTLKGQFGQAQCLAEETARRVPGDRRLTDQLALLRKTCAMVLREYDQRFFPDTIGATSGKWWEGDLLARVRGWEGQAASVPAPMILEEITRPHLDGVYAVGIYKPWHEQGIKPLFTQWIKALKQDGRTIGHAATLLWQGLTRDLDSDAPDWIENVDVVVPMATSLRSFEARDGLELTESLAGELAKRLCIPMVDMFERDSLGDSTHQLSRFAPRLEALETELRLKRAGHADLERAHSVLIVDDVVTYGATFEACARKLKQLYPHLRCYGAALAYTETKARRERALRERAA